LTALSAEGDQESETGSFVFLELRLREEEISYVVFA